MKWISVKSIKPPEEDILCYVSCGFIHVGHWRMGRHCLVGYFPDEIKSPFFDEYEFTYWMPLPQPPKEE